MTAAPPESTQPKSLHLASSALETASSSEAVKKAVSFLSYTYSKVSETTKHVLPSSLATRFEAVETYLGSFDKEKIVSAVDGTVDTVYVFSSDAVAAKFDNKLVDFLADKVLTAAEGIVTPEEKKDSISPSSSSSRLASLAGNVSKQVTRKASAGVIQLRDAVVPADVVIRANEFIDHQVKPQVTYVAGISSNVAEKINTTTVATTATIKQASASVSKGIHVVYDEFHTRVVDVASDVITANKDEPDTVKGKLIISAFLQQTRLAWNDFFVVPVSSYLGLPDLKPVTLYKGALDSKYYAAARNQYVAATTAVSQSFTYIVSLPSVLLDKTIIELRERYLEFTGKEFNSSTAFPAIVDATKSRVYVGLLTIQDYSKVLVKKSVSLLARYLPARVVKAITSGPLRIIEATEEVIEDN